MSAAIYVALQRAKEVERRIQEFYDTINRLLQWVPDTLANLIEPIVEGLKWLRRKVSEFWAKIRPYLEVTGDPEKLERYAAVLVDKVAVPLNDIAGDVAPEKLGTNTEWTGTGAEAYKAVLPAQGDNLEDLRDLATELGNTLKELANGIENFWWAMGLAYLALAVGVVGAVAEVVSVAGAPLSIPTVAGAVGVALAAITTAIIELKNIYDTVDVSQDKITQGIVQLGDEWARATPKNQAKIDSPDNWRPIDGPARPPKVPGVGPISPTPPGDQLPPPITVPPEPPSQPGVPPPPSLPPVAPPTLPGVPPPTAPPPALPPVTPPTNPPTLPGVPPPFTGPVPLPGPVPPPDDDFGPVPPPGTVPPPDDFDPRPPFVPPPVTPSPGGIDIGPDLGTSPSSVTSPAAASGSGGASVPGLGGGQQPVSGGIGLSQAGGFTGAATPAAGGPGRTAAGGAMPAAGRPNQGGLGGFPFGGMGAGKGGEDQTHTNKWRVEGQLFDDADDAASFNGVVGKDPGKR